MENITKQKIIDSAITLFNTKGYSGTSVREISKMAKTNVSNISYYFMNKAGLQEYLITSFFDSYLNVLEEGYQQLKTMAPKECMVMTVKLLMQYHKEHRHLARFVYREITLDTVLVREVMSTYLTKEKFYWKAFLEEGKRQKELQAISIPMTIVHLKSMISMPFLQAQYLAEVWHYMPYEPNAMEQYNKMIIEWLEQSVFASPSYHQPLAL
ncbi:MULTISPECIES: forespore capture DNA-binding protein RefZ [Sutcliffiella]|uniref:forespore capture DNA-binding protein RefZ n=1 Tax=Sutcliffiella TaxID=2837511 RepID=UPI0022DDA683|nr:MULTISPECIES: forespore capture DNA-binding protein RefZ [Sutcliffiella]MED4016180.1 forespore capture DNA-binding protein RefZ [Sutcliffiella cohnii]WBL14123.1 forespore capture DNA-binding protein RefZ [Sutcliffiella sp. NC1]